MENQPQYNIRMNPLLLQWILSNFIVYFCCFNLINASDVYDNKITLPPGCICVQSNVRPEDCHAFDCNCPCDLTVDFCDWNCCCDPDCTDNDNEEKECQNPYSPYLLTRMCYDSYSTTLESIRPSYPIRQVSPKVSL